MIKKKVTIKNKLGLHARPCSLLVKAASNFRSEIKIQKDDMLVNGKSIMGVMMLAAECGAELEILIEGVDQEAALETLENLIENKFNEE
ncbi:MAG: HPr family phosphocarrier protein [Candidatus Cloacimonetes bacterium]|nr:HPr family phosphocarrier protein [Candidatus Cloacimonadota bacterium]